jgi:AMIN domain
VRVVPGPEGAAIEILATRPLTPAITTVNNPLRLVVDLPKSLVTSRIRINYRDPQVLRVRVNQFHLDPPTVRLVIDLDKDAKATWDGAGNRLMVRLHPAEVTSGDVSATSSQGTAPALIGGSTVSGALLLAGGRIATGSAVTAGTDTAILHMAQGGEVRVCPGTTVSVTPSQNGRDVMLGMNTGAMEAHYRLETSADSIVTPDFHILFAGPGEFHYAVSADSRGNTCVRALRGNSASAVVSELMGDGVYQVKPSEEVVFRSGRLTSIDANVPADCGCPAASVPVMRAAAAEERKSAEEGVPALAAQPAGAQTIAASRLPHGSETASLPAVSPKDVHIQVDAPFVFRAADRHPPPAPILEATNLPLARFHHTDPLQLTALPPAGGISGVPAGVARNSRKGFFGKIGSFFGGLFR